MANWRDKGPDDFSLSPPPQTSALDEPRGNLPILPAVIFILGAVLGATSGYLASSGLNSGGDVQSLLQAKALELDEANNQIGRLTATLTQVAQACDALIANETTDQVTARQFCIRQEKFYGPVLTVLTATPPNSE